MKKLSVMKKSIIYLSVLLMLVGAAAISTIKPVNAEQTSVLKDLFENSGDWMMQQNDGSAKFNRQNELEIISVETSAKAGVNSAVYIKEKYGNASIEFDFKIEFNDGVYPEDYLPGSMSPSCFFGIMFLQNIDVKVPSASIGIPWDIPGGYPYMLAFDTEISGGEANRKEQVGLTLRRYKYGGSHDYVRWSTVKPTNETFTNSAGESYESKVPDFYTPVTIPMIWDGNAHKVKLDYTTLYKANGDEKDAMKITAWYDGEKVLEVIDDMPFKGEELGDEVDIDKRGGKGYLAFYACHDKNSPSLDNYSYKLIISDFKVAGLAENAPVINGGDVDNPNLNWLWFLLIIPVAGVGAAVAVIIAKKNKKGKKDV